MSVRQGTDTESEYFKEVCCEYEKEQVIDDTLSAFVEQNTTGQSECQLWKMLHNGRLTSSVVGEIMHRRDSTNPDSILRCIMGYTQMMGTPLAIQWGKVKESVARDTYICCQNEKPGAQRFAMQNHRTDTVTMSFLLGCII